MKAYNCGLGFIKVRIFVLKVASLVLASEGIMFTKNHFTFFWKTSFFFLTDRTIEIPSVIQTDPVGRETKQIPSVLTPNLAFPNPILNFCGGFSPSKKKTDCSLPC
jgi:hypothetical protein